MINTDLAINRNSQAAGSSVEEAEQKVAYTYQVERNVAQYKDSSFENVVAVRRNITLEQAKEIADANPDIDYFMFVKGPVLALEASQAVSVGNDPFKLAVVGGYIGLDGHYHPNPAMRVFHEGDVVFFNKNGLWLGSAPGLADIYYKEDAVRN